MNKAVLKLEQKRDTMQATEPDWEMLERQLFNALQWVRRAQGKEPLRTMRRRSRKDGDGKSNN